MEAGVGSGVGSVVMGDWACVGTTVESDALSRAAESRRRRRFMR